MAQKSITAFFQTNGQSKEKRRETAPSSNGTKRTKIALARVHAELEGPTTTREEESAKHSNNEITPLSTEELRAQAARATEIAKVRVSQAAAQGVPPRLEDLLADESWRAALAAEFKKSYMTQLATFLSAEWKAQTIYPPQPLVFRAFNTCPIDQVRVVIIGQDPYHNTGQAVGLSFSVPPGKAVPSSLQNIYKELHADCGCNIPKHGNLEKWSYQGVLLLNAVLTVRAHTPASHSKKGWETLTDAAISALSARREGLVFLMWGRFAQQKEVLIDTKKHHVLKAAHPSGFSANKGFFGCGHFSKANALLEKAGLPPIDWQIDA
ncbi:Uracil-DNA glycosylase [Coccomyxa sp. Obi]|nr:Uracil-DNA glycosylase [Coccomyxa sp. Obi]